VAELWVVPDCEDFIFAGRDVSIHFLPGGDRAGIEAELGRMAQMLRNGTSHANYRLVSESSRQAVLGADGLEVEVGIYVGAEVGALLLQFARNHIRRAGLPSQNESIVMTDPYDLETK
jgi:hypothetical protein